MRIFTASTVSGPQQQDIEVPAWQVACGLTAKCARLGRFALNVGSIFCTTANYVGEQALALFGCPLDERLCLFKSSRV
jgi:hypothetical protein